MKNKLPLLAIVFIVLAVAAIVGLGGRRKDPEDAGDALNEAGAPPLAATATAAATPAAAPPAIRRKPPTIGDQLLVQAAARLERRASISARLRHQLRLGGNQLYGIGSYWQQGSADELRVRLELQIAGQDAKLLQVSNGRFLWLELNLPTGRRVTNVDLRKLRADPSLAPSNLDELVPGTATWTATGSELLRFTGGLPSLLASLSEHFEFLPPQAMRLAAQTANDPQAASIPVFAVVGHWREEKLAALLAKGQEARVEGQEPETLDSRRSTLDSIPARLPEEVLLLVGQADLFPYRIEYRRLETPPAKGDGPPIPYQLSANPLVVLELLDVAFDVPIATGQFDYAPGDAEWTDQTAVVLERLRQQRDQVAGRATDAATSRK